MLPIVLSVMEISTSVTLPQLVTAPLMVCGWPATAVEQFLLTVRHGLSAAGHTLVSAAETGVPQMLTPETVTMFVVPPQIVVSSLVKTNDPPGGRNGTLVKLPTRLSVSMTLVSVTLPQLVTTPPMICITPVVQVPVEQLPVTPMHGLSVVTQVLVALAETGVPQRLTPEAVTILVLPPQVAVTVLL